MKKVMVVLCMAQGLYASPQRTVTPERVHELLDHWNTQSDKAITELYSSVHADGCNTQSVIGGELQAQWNQFEHLATEDNVLITEDQMKHLETLYQQKRFGWLVGSVVGGLAAHFLGEGHAERDAAGALVGGLAVRCLTSKRLQSYEQSYGSTRHQQQILQRIKALYQLLTAPSDAVDVHSSEQVNDVRLSQQVVIPPLPLHRLQQSQGEVQLCKEDKSQRTGDDQEDAEGENDAWYYHVPQDENALKQVLAQQGELNATPEPPRRSVSEMVQAIEERTGGTCEVTPRRLEESSKTVQALHEDAAAVTGGRDHVSHVSLHDTADDGRSVEIIPASDDDTATTQSVEFSSTGDDFESEISPDNPKGCEEHSAGAQRECRTGSLLEDSSQDATENDLSDDDEMSTDDEQKVAPEHVKKGRFTLMGSAKKAAKKVGRRIVGKKKKNKEPLNGE